MRLPPIELDDRRFQELVSEARTRIVRTCPEWTEHNVSDPGITLIELFAWMTEMTVYRLNRVPDKVHVELLDLLGIQLRPPAPARVDVRFLLSAPPAEPVRITARETEVGTPRTITEDAVVFGVTESITIPPLRPTAYVLRRGEDVRDVATSAGEARPMGADRATFGTPPTPGDALHLGFEATLHRLVVEVLVEAEPARGAGVDPADPPLQWEVATGDDRWEAATVLEDTTGGFNLGSGRILLELPPGSARTALGGHRLHWLRCSLLAPRSTRDGVYQQPPLVSAITAAPIGATLPAEHAERIDGEVLGESDGTPGQRFKVLEAPMLQPARDEGLEVRDPHTGRWERWAPVASFADSGPEDEVYLCDPATGSIELGPAVRQADGGWRRYGAVPPKGARLRMVSYRRGGGLEGNVQAGTLSVLKAGPAGIATVTNPLPAMGGVDAEPLSAVRERGAMELRARHRAVTAEDFEHLALKASPRVARAVCVPPSEGSAISVRVLPRIHKADRLLSRPELMASRDLLEEVAAYLDDRRLLGATVEVAPARLRGVSVVVDVQCTPTADTERIRQDVERSLTTFLNPLIGGLPGEVGEGWEFGRTLNQGELYGVVHAAEGVEYVRLLRIYETDLRTGQRASEPAGSHVVLEPDEVIASGPHAVKVSILGASS